MLFIRNRRLSVTAAQQWVFRCRLQTCFKNVSRCCTSVGSVSTFGFALLTLYAKCGDLAPHSYQLQTQFLLPIGQRMRKERTACLCASYAIEVLCYRVMTSGQDRVWQILQSPLHPQRRPMRTLWQMSGIRHLRRLTRNGAGHTWERGCRGSGPSAVEVLVHFLGERPFPR